jgi:hypothetical protein
MDVLKAAKMIWDNFRIERELIKEKNAKKDKFAKMRKIPKRESFEEALDSEFDKILNSKLKKELKADPKLVKDKDGNDVIINATVPVDANQTTLKSSPTLKQIKAQHPVKK